MTLEEQNELAAQNIALVKCVINRHFMKSTHVVPYDDLFQIGCIGLIRASRGYDPSKGAFSTYAIPCIRSEIWRAFRHLNRRGNQHNGLVSLDACIIDTDNVSGHEVFRSPDNTEDEAVARAAYNAAILGLNDVNLRTLGMLASGMNQREAARALGTSQAAVSRRMKLFRQACGV